MTHARDRFTLTHHQRPSMKMHPDNRIAWLVGLGISVVLLFSGCTPGDTETSETASTEEEDAQEAVHWGYEGEEGPEHWGALSADYGGCATGQRQSPVDLTVTDAEDLADPVFKYQPSAFAIFNNGHTIQVNYEAGSTIEVDGIPYRLLQFHFHHPSEHTVAGASFPMEMHLVHQNEERGLAVVGVLLQRGRSNQALAPIWGHLPADKGEAERISGVTINASDLLPEERSFYQYEGSLTTPPCTEGVRWMVMRTPIELSEAQLAAFDAIHHINNRPVQPLGNRTVRLDASAN